MADSTHIRRVRIARPASGDTRLPSSSQHAELRGMLKSISEEYPALLEAMRRHEELKKQVAEYMTAHNVASFLDHGVVAAMERSAGKSSTHIDPQRFYEACSSLDDFFKGVKVMIQQAKMVLPTKVVEELSDITPAKLGEPSLSITMPGVSDGQGKRKKPA